MKPSGLANHNFKKGKFITPFNSIPMLKSLSDDESWTFGRLPEYLWVGLILDQLGRKEGLKSLYLIIKELGIIEPMCTTPKMSLIDVI